MLQIQDTIISFDLLKEQFRCDLDACKGQCCIEGDAGAPLEPGEPVQLEALLPIIWDDLAPEARNVIRRQGVCYRDQDGDLVTSIVNGRDCVFTCRDAKGRCLCAIEKAGREGKTDIPKPISCQLYPVRVTQYATCRAVNYHRWDICQAATLAGRKTGTPLYRFLKEPLIRKFGEEWYRELEIAARELEGRI